MLMTETKALSAIITGMAKKQNEQNFYQIETKARSENLDLWKHPSRWSSMLLVSSTNCAVRFLPGGQQKGRRARDTYDGSGYVEN
jgi:hypothetical protein